MKPRRFIEEQIIGILKQLEDEIKKLKQMLADAIMENKAIKDVISVA